METRICGYAAAVDSEGPEGEPPSFRAAVIGSLVVCSFFFLICAVYWHALFSQRQKSAAERQYHQMWAPVVSERGLALFEKLDADGDDLLHHEELRNAHLEGRFTGKDGEVVEYLYTYCELIGHEIGRYKSGKYTYSVIGISRIDLKHYPGFVKLRPELLGK